MKRTCRIKEREKIEGEPKETTAKPAAVQQRRPVPAATPSPPAPAWEREKVSTL